MLTPEYLLKVSEGAEDIAERLHQDIINRIVERIMQRLDRGDSYILTAYDKWQIQVLEDAGFLLEDIKKEIAKKTKLMQTEIAEAMEEAGVKAISYDNAIYEAAGISTTPLDMSPHLIRLMQRDYEKTLGEMKNFTGTLANSAQKLFIQECDKAYNLVTSGALSYTQAVKEAVETIASDGVTVHYPSGHTDTIETATLRAVRTGVAQATADITNKRMEEYGWDIILVSSHLGARVTDNEDFTNHYWWQGQFYSKSGKDKRFKPFSVCGMGHVQGLCGANCRHSYGPGDGEFNPYRQYDSEENRKAYETEQRQRALERRIRKTKREVMTTKKARDSAQSAETRAELDMEYQKKAALLQKQNKAYNDYCAENDLKKRADRIAIAKWDRQQAAQARGAAKRYNNTVENSANTLKTSFQNGNIVSTSGARITNTYDKRAREHAERYYGLVRSMTTDVEKISKVTGYSITDIQNIKNYLFIEQHDLGGLTPQNFDPDFAIAQSWQRLIIGHPEPHDLTMIQHEITERQLVNAGWSQRDAHIKASEKYNYAKESDDYYATLEKHKDK